MKYISGYPINNSNRISNPLITNAAFLSSFFSVIFKLFLLRLGKMFQGKTITKIILSETEVRVNFWLVSFECSHCVRNGRQGKEVSYGLS